MKSPFTAEARPCLSVRSTITRKPRAARSTAILTVAILLGSGLFASVPAFAKDPCKTVLCMYGKFSGSSGGSECNTPEQDYFDILVKKHGKVKWDKTSTLREEFLNSCPGADKGVNKKINDKFGKALG